MIQDDLGITGTTAQEAATTLSGSFASMQAAASNVLADLTLGRDIGPALEGLAQTVSTFLCRQSVAGRLNILRRCRGRWLPLCSRWGRSWQRGLFPD